MFDWADPIFDGIAGVLAWFYSLVPDYTFAICMLTLAIMLLFTPLTLRGARTMTKTQALQPELAQLRKKHTGDRQKLNEETMKLYQANGVSPLGGCLPNLAQIPIFIVLYRVIWNLRIPEQNPIDKPFPRNLSPDSQLYQDIVNAGGEMRSLGMDLSEAAKDVIQSDFVEGLPYLGLVAVTFLLAWLQQRQMAARRGNTAMPNRQMEIMMKYMPFMLPVFSFFVPAALVPYFIVSSVYRMLTQAFIHATMKPAKPLVTPESSDDVIEVETVSEPEPPRQVPNQRSRKALDAEAARRVAREQRRAARRSGSRNSSHESAPEPALPEPALPEPALPEPALPEPALPEPALPEPALPEPALPEPSETPSVRRTRSSEERVTDARKRSRRGGTGSRRYQTSERGRKRRRGQSEPESKPIQSRRTSGDGRTRNRRKR